MSFLGTCSTLRPGPGPVVGPVGLGAGLKVLGVPQLPPATWSTAAPGALEGAAIVGTP